jgi:hypothetical protein
MIRYDSKARRRKHEKANLDSRDNGNGGSIGFWRLQRQGYFRRGDGKAQGWYGL